MSEAKPIPSELDWENYWTDPDSNWAHDKFCGKSIDDVAPYFYGSVLSAIEDLGHMPTVPFQFYFSALIGYLTDSKVLDDENSDKADGASAFLWLVKWKLADDPKIIMPLMESLLPLIDYVGSNQSLYDASQENYGSFDILRNEIRTLFTEKLSSVHSLPP